MATRKSTDYIIIHCAATRPSMDIGAREIDQWHRKEGWLGIGYQYVIRRDGTMETGRGLMEPGAHAGGYNTKSVGICLVGGVAENDVNKPENNYTPAQWDALRTLVGTLKHTFPGAKIIGHNQVAAKACPCFDVPAWVKQQNIFTESDTIIGKL